MTDDSVRARVLDLWRGTSDTARFLAWVVLLVVLLALTILSTGCTRVGSKWSSDRDGRPIVENGSPVTLQIEDADKKGTANGIGPARFTSITEGEVQTMQTGTVPRDLWLKLPNGAQFNLSSGTDIMAEGVTFNPATGAFSVKTFGTSASDPLKAHNEGLATWSQYLNHLASMSVEARKAELDAIKAVSAEAFQAVSVGLKLLGVP